MTESIEKKCFVVVQSAVYAVRKELQWQLPDLIVPEALWKKMWVFVRRAPEEIKGFGTVVADGKNLRCADILLPPQKTTGGSAATKGFAMYLDDLVRKGGDPEHLLLEWHSHGNGSLFWSLQDNENIENLLCTAPMFVSLEVNRHGEYLCRLDVRFPVRLTVPINVRLELEELPQEVQDECHRQVAENIHELMTEEDTESEVRLVVEGELYESSTDPLPTDGNS